MNEVVFSGITVPDEVASFVLLCPGDRFMLEGGAGGAREAVSGGYGGGLVERH